LSATRSRDRYCLAFATKVKILLLATDRTRVFLFRAVQRHVDAILHLSVKARTILFCCVNCLIIASMPTATALFPFVPSGKDFASALAFFGELGFATAWQADGLAGLTFGKASFLLQNIDAPQWADNQMLVLEVDDLDAYWRAIDAKGLPARYAGVRTKEPTDYPWGREVHIIDPAGVCWHVRESRP
jgi:predicted enzyme related to lactoylglutathione lyase